MNRTVRTDVILAAWNALSASKYGKLDDADKIKVWKISRVLQPVAKKFDEDTKDAGEKLKPTEDFTDRWQKAQEYERVTRDPKADASTLEMGPSEYNEFIKEMNKYNKLVSDAVKEFAEKEVEIEFDPLTEDSFVKLMNSNDWTFDQVRILGEILV